MLLTVQRQWMYLENIFLGEDIRRQLPRESAEFDDVNSNWKIIMTHLNKTKNALRGTHQEGKRKLRIRLMRKERLLCSHIPVLIPLGLFSWICIQMNVDFEG